jgi:RND family efflux transporter MFP subunit
MKKFFLKTVLILLTIFLNLFNSSCSNKEAKQTEEIKIPVKVYVVKPTNLVYSLKLTGSITAGNDAVIYSKVSERIEKIFLKVGSNVNENQVIAVQYNAALKQSLNLAEANLRNAEAQLNLIKSEFERAQRLYEQKALSKQQYDQIQTQKTAAEAGYEAAKAQYNQAFEMYQNSFIKSPFKGKIAAIFVEKDQMVPAGQPVAQVISEGSMKAKLKVSGENISKVKVGQKATIKFPTIPEQTFFGFVSQIDKALNPISKTLGIEITITSKSDLLKSGMFGEFFIELEKLEGIISLPDNVFLKQTEAIINKETGQIENIKKYFVFVVNNGIAQLKEIKTGISAEGRTCVISGLMFGDSVIVSGQNIVKNNQKVLIVE